VELEGVAELGEELNTPGGVAVLVQRRREGLHPAHVRDHHEDLALNTGFLGQPDLELELTGIVIHAAGEHDRQNVPDGGLGQNLVPSQRVPAPVLEGLLHRGHHVLVHGEGAAAEVEL